MSSDPSSLPDVPNDDPYLPPPPGWTDRDAWDDLIPRSENRGPLASGVGDVVTVEMFATATVWISGAVGAGMLGNSAYDAFKVAISRLLHRDGEPKPLTQAEAVVIARKALQDRVDQAMVVDFPDVATLRVAEWSLSDSGWSIWFQGGRNFAQVKIPTNAAGKDGVYVKVGLGRTKYCTECGQPNHVNWVADHRLGVENFLPDESCDNRDCERYGKGPEKR
ncbi:hypothetical protein ABZ793_23615 [Micromonospora sp. NPDC047465]|uniref:hypothetical protein n=1 Tax=Micromonospora sp. NPDC047465 TaxID=3154813 RepID=UPI0033E394F9